MTAPAREAAGRWAGAWPDALGFAGGLALAWIADWQTGDLVWSLWLSSLSVGYALIGWRVTAPLREFVAEASKDPHPGAFWAKVLVGTIIGLGCVPGLAFFALHFGGFHYVHAAFVNYFFPVLGEGQAARGFPTLASYAEVVRRYWPFVPLAFLAERQAFRGKRPDGDTAVIPEAIARRKAQGDAMMEPYKNVIRLHLLIFFFFAAHVARLENFAVYAVVYAVYFFPWRLLRRPPSVKSSLSRIT